MFSQVLKFDENGSSRIGLMYPYIMSTILYSLGYCGWEAWDIFCYVKKKKIKEMFLEMVAVDVNGNVLLDFVLHYQH